MEFAGLISCFFGILLVNKWSRDLIARKWGWNIKLLIISINMKRLLPNLAYFWQSESIFLSGNLYVKCWSHDLQAWKWGYEKEERHINVANESGKKPWLLHYWTVKDSRWQAPVRDTQNLFLIRISFKIHFFKKIIHMKITWCFKSSLSKVRKLTWFVDII